MLTDEQITKLWYEIIHNHDSNQFNTFAHAIYKLGQLYEREECAKIADGHANAHEFKASTTTEQDEVSELRSVAWKFSHCAANIRARTP